MKKILIAISIIILAALAAFVIWFTTNKKDATIPPGETAEDLLPFGSGDDAGQPTTESKRPATSYESRDFFNNQGVPVREIFPISEEPVAGATIFSRAGKTVVRYADRATGHIFEVVMPGATSTPLVRDKISNNTLPKVYEAYFRPDGGSVLMRMLESSGDEQRNIILNISATSSAVNVRGRMGSVTVGNNNQFYFVDTDTKSIISSPFSSTLRSIFTSKFTDWILSPAGNNLLLATKASSNHPGYLYVLNTTNGSLTKIAGPLNGLSARSGRNGEWIIYSYNDGGLIRSNLTNTSSEITQGSSPSAIADKCAASQKKSGVFYCGTSLDELVSGSLDLWYQGKMNFTDYIWSYDANADISNILINPMEKFGLALDIYRPMVSPDDTFLLFINKRDLMLWAVRVSAN